MDEIDLKNDVTPAVDNGESNKDATEPSDTIDDNKENADKREDTLNIKSKKVESSFSLDLCLTTALKSLELGEKLSFWISVCLLGILFFP